MWDLLQRKVASWYVAYIPIGPSPTKTLAVCPPIVFLQAVMPLVFDDVRQGVWLQHDGAPPYCGGNSRKWLVRRELPKEMDWAWGAHRFASLFEWNNSVGFFPTSALEGRWIFSSRMSVKDLVATLRSTIVTLEADVLQPWTRRYDATRFRLP